MKMLLLVWVLFAGLQLSRQDLVTVEPSLSFEPELDQPKPSSTEKPTIRSLHAVSDIKYRYATTLVSSRVVNPSNQSAEAAFSIILPESAFISEFLMDIKGTVYKAYVKEKEEAKAVYDQAVQAGQFAGHVALDARDSNQFTVSVNIEAHGKVTFNLTYEQLLSRNLGVYSNIININPQQIVDDMSVTVNIEEPTTIMHLEVPELQVLSNEAIPVDTKENTLAKIEEISSNKKQVTWAPTPEQQKDQNSTGVSGQFIVKYDVDREQNAQQILVDEGYFVHFFAPENLPKLRKHVVFVLDYSGSMVGRKLEQLKDAMDKILSDLSSTDYFSIVNFQSYIEAWSPAKMYNTAKQDLSPWELEHSIHLNSSSLDKDFVVEASATNIDLARGYLRNFTDLGATNIIGGLRTGLELVNIGTGIWENESNAPQPVVVFLTDGEPNVEEYDTNKIIEKTKVLNTKESPIFSLAFGRGADFNFLRKLSLSNFGFARNIYEAADASIQLNNFYRTIASPLLSNITFTYLPGQVINSSSTKNEFPIFFSGSEIVVAGKINKNAVEDKTTIGKLSGNTANGKQTYDIVIDYLKPENRTLGHLEKTWAYLTIQQLLDKADSLDDGSEKNQTKDKALELALEYSFVTPLTSLVVVKPNETESAVDATKITPGMEQIYPLSGSAGGFIGGVPSSAGGYGVPSGAGGFGVPIMQSSAFGMAAPAGFPAMNMKKPSYSGYLTTPYSPQFTVAPMSSADIVDKSTLEVEPLIAGDTVDKSHQKVNLSDITWLQQTDPDNSTVFVQGQEYKLGINETDSSFGTCQVNNVTGECYHLQYCALDIFKDDVSAFIPYQCSITGGYLGVCCPVVS